MANKIIKMLILLENILCINRNTWSTAKNNIMVYLRLSIEVIMIFGCVYTYTRFMSGSCKSNLIFYYLNLGNSFIIMFIAWYKSQDFHHLLMLIERNNLRLKTDDIYQRRIKNKLRHFIIALILTFVFPFLISWVEYIDDNYKNPYIFIIYSICIAICNIRYILEYVVIYALLFTLSELTKCVTRKLKKESIMVALIGISKNNTGDNNAGNLKECSIIYKNIKECFRLINAIFALLFTVMLATVTIYFVIVVYGITFTGVKFTVMLATVTIYFVIVVYGITFTGVKLRPSVSIVVLTCMKFMYFFVPLYKVSSMAQTTQNSVDSLRRNIAHRLISLPLDDENLKATRKFLQLVRPIKIQALGYINIDMALIPKIIMFFTTYAVTALQFNNVI